MHIKAILVGFMLAPLLWVWIEYFLFNGGVVLVSAAIYFFLFIFLAERFLGDKTTTLDKHVQTHMKEQSTQTEDLPFSDMEFDAPEMQVEVLEAETHMAEEASTESEERPNSSQEIDQDSPTQPGNEGSLVPEDPSLSLDDATGMEDDKVVQANKREGGKLPFFRRKMRKLFKKK